MRPPQIVFSFGVTFDQFTQFSEKVQLAYVYREGTYIARRWDDFH